MTVWCTDLELSGPHPSRLQRPGVPGWSGTVRVLARLHGFPLGFVEKFCPPEGIDVELLMKALNGDLLDEANRHLADDGTLPVAAISELAPASSETGVLAERCPRRIVPTELMTVVVCTRDRPEVLRGCLAQLRELNHPQLEILIVDNAPTDDAGRQVFTETIGEDARFRYVREPRPGLSCARNRGWQEARGRLIAYTDDDVRVDPDWARALAAGFRDDAVAAVTGLVGTASIEGPAEQYFDARVSWGDSCRPAEHRIGGPSDDGLFPYSPGIFGTGASFAVRADVLQELGGFDEALAPVPGPPAGRTWTRSSASFWLGTPWSTNRRPWSGTSTVPIWTGSGGRCSPTAPGCPPSWPSTCSTAAPGGRY